MDITILGIESSCDETAAAVVKNGREILSNIISSQISTEYKYDEESGAEIGIDKTIHTIEIEFIGQLTSYKVIANFDVADVKITTTFAVQNIDVVAAGVIVTENGETVKRFIKK